MCRVVQRISILHSGMSAGSTVVSSASVIILVILYFYFCSPQSCQMFANFIDLFKESALGVIDFLYCVSTCKFIDFCTYVYYFLPFLCFGFILFLFFQIIQVEVDYLFKIFFLISEFSFKNSHLALFQMCYTNFDNLYIHFHSVTCMYLKFLLKLPF